MLGCQFHPEFGSRPNRPHPLFSGFIGAASKVLREGSQPALPIFAEQPAFTSQQSAVSGQPGANV
jgi:CTP synthase